LSYKTGTRHDKSALLSMRNQWRSQEFCSGGASQRRRQISNFRYFAQKIILMSLVNFWSITTGYDVKYLQPVGIDNL